MPHSITRIAIPAMVLLTFAAAARVMAQQHASPVPAEIRHYEIARSIAVHAAPLIWPGFRLDTIPLRLVLPERGTLLFGWTGPRPAGFAPLGTMLWMPEADRGAASTNTSMDNRAVAQAVVNDTATGVVAGLIGHESFHAYERSVQKDGVKFGGGENSYYVSQYPVYEVANETQFALELAVLRDAITAPTIAVAREKARQFLAVRFARQHAMDVNVAEFEAMSELNEGLAEYVLIRTAAQVPGSRTAFQVSADRMRNLLSTTALSVRLRFYVTGSGIALLLDRIGPSGWKAQLMRRNITLQELLAQSVGAPTNESLVTAASTSHTIGALRSAATERVETLQRSVRARADSLMARPGIKLVLDGSATGIGSCGFDPQNMLQLGGGSLLHTRWLKACQYGIDLEFNTAVVQADKKMTAVIGDAAAVALTSAGASIPIGADAEYHDVHIDSPGVKGTIAHAHVAHTVTGITIMVLTP